MHAGSSNNHAVCDSAYSMCTVPSHTHIHMQPPQVAIKISVDRYTARSFAHPRDAADYRWQKRVRAKCEEEYEVRAWLCGHACMLLLAPHACALRSIPCMHATGTDSEK